MTQLLQIPHGLLRRHLTTVERILGAAGLAGLIYALLNELPVYPPYWDVVIVAAVFLSALWAPNGAYFLAVITAVYPLYSFSLYVAVLFLAVALLGQRIFIYHLGATVLVLLAPWLARYRLVWVIPILGGLWWGKSGGIWMGGLAALWGQIIAGMSGLSPDWLSLLGTIPESGAIVQRFEAANSLETLFLIVEPFVPDTTSLLYFLLQITAWATVGGLVGRLADNSKVQRRHPWGTILIGAIGALALPGAHLGLGLWMDQYTLESLAPLWNSLLFTTFLVIFVVSTLEGLRDILEHPLPVRPKPRRVPQQESPPETEHPPLPIPAELPEEEPRKDNDDLIMLELD